MRKIFLCLLFVASVLSMVSCTDDVKRYELVDGEPDVDYIEFVDDSTCVVAAAGPVELLCLYTEKDGQVTIHVMDGVCGTLIRQNRRTLVGESAFFEGTWVKVRCHRENETDEQWDAM